MKYESCKIRQVEVEVSQKEDLGDGIWDTIKYGQRSKNKKCSKKYAVQYLKNDLTKMV